MCIRRICFSTLGFVFVLFLTSTDACSQDRRLLIVSPRVGTEIDSVERLSYNLFPSVEDFQNAAVYRLPDSTFWVWLLLKSPEGNVRDSAYEISSTTLKQIAEWIEHKRGIIDGTYSLGTMEPSILYEDGSPVTLPKTTNEKAMTRRTNGPLPLAANSADLSRPFFQTIHLDLSLGFGSAYFADLGVLTGSGSNAYVPVSFSIDIPLQAEDGFALRAGWGFALGGAGGGSLANYTLTLSYRVRTDNFFKPFIGIGVGYSSYSYSGGQSSSYYYAERQGDIEVSAIQSYPMLVFGTSIVYQRLDLMVSIPLVSSLSTTFEDRTYQIRAAGFGVSLLLSL